jgi:3D (Asp-Asp-Asp) domain-containing protein
MQSLNANTRTHSLFTRAAALSLTIVCAVSALSQTVFAKNTYVITDGDQVKIHSTYTTDPADVLTEAGVLLDDVDTFVTEPGKGETEITIHRGMSVSIDCFGKPMQAVSYGETVCELLERLEIRLPENAEISVELDAPVTDGMEIALSTTVLSNDTYTAEIPFQTVYQETNLLKAGTEVVLTKGVNGQMLCTAEVTYVNGIETVRTVLTEETVTEAVDRVIAVGTGDGTVKKGKPIIGDGVIIAPNGDVLTFTSVDKFSATAYTHTDPGCDMITATGTTVHMGTIAVDPSVIPYGTRMFIVSKDGRYIYGVSTAEDCGKSIKNKKVDLYFPTYDQCIQFGVRDVYIYFLG